MCGGAFDPPTQGDTIYKLCGKDTFVFYIQVSSETAAQVTETFQTILSNVSAEDQTEDNVALVADLLSNLASPGVQINEEVMYLMGFCTIQHIHII